MKAHVVIAENAVYKTGEHMLAAVLLHHVQPPHAIHMSMHLAPDFKRNIGQMLDLALHVVRIQNPRFIQRAMIRALPAAFRKKRGLVQHDGVAVPFLFAADDDRGKIQLIYILLI